MIKEYLGEIITFVTTGGLMTIMNHLRDKKKDKIEEFEKIIAEWKKVLDEVKENERQCEERYDKLILQFAELQKRDKEMQEEISALRKKINQFTK